MDRRAFLTASSMASSSLMVPGFLRALKGFGSHRSRSEKILIVVQLSGGNDGINTFVPFGSDLYYKSRPTLGLNANEIIKMTDDLAFNASLFPIRNMFDASELCVVNNVGYPNPDRSHFRSMDIWQTGSDSREYLSSGWIGRYLDSNCDDCSIPYYAMEIDNNLSLALKGYNRDGFAMKDPRALLWGNKNPYLKSLAAAFTDTHHDQANYLYKTMIETQQAASYIHSQSQIHTSTVEFPDNGFGKQLKLISELITANTDTRIYYVSLSGFDTHANQKARHNQLLKVYAEGMAALVKELKHNNLYQDTLIMTFSEFGRRIGQNGSGGTDHGTANNLILMSGSLKKVGFINEPPDLSALDQGDLIYTVDFRSIYSEILEKWLKASPEEILNKKFEHLNFIS